MLEKIQNIIKTECYRIDGRVNPNRAKVDWWISNHSVDEYKFIMEYTNALPNDASWSNRVWHIINGTKKIPHCNSANCQKRLIWDNTVPGYREYCSNNCVSRSTRGKAKKTMLDRFGVDNAAKSPSLREKTKKTNILRHGAEHPLQSSSIREKQQGTMLARHGVRHALQSVEFKEKTKNTNLIKYGEDNPLKIKEIRESIGRTNLERYGFKNAFQNSLIKERMSKTLLQRYGATHPKQIHFSNEHTAVLNNPAWLEAQHYGKKKTLLEISSDLGLSASCIGRSFRKHGIPVVGFNTSYFEKQIQELFTEHDVYFESNTKRIIGHELDLYFPDYKIAIECNGSYYHSEKEKSNANSRGKEYHLNKTKLCEEKGIQLIHIWEHDWIKNPELIKRRLLSKLGLNERVFARKTQVAKLTTQTAAEFLNQHHIQGTCPASLKYGLYDQDELVAVMTLGKSRFSKNYEWELLRYCSTKQVTGGASKLFKHFQREHQPKSVVSYSDKMWNTGNLYKQLGFEHSHASKPSYYYTKNYYDYENRVAYQKHKLHKKLEYFDPNLTEWENMQDNGFDRIWDCGSDVWGWNDKYTHTVSANNVVT